MRTRTATPTTLARMRDNTSGDCGEEGTIFLFVKFSNGRIPDGRWTGSFCNAFFFNSFFLWSVAPTSVNRMIAFVLFLLRISSHHGPHPMHSCPTVPPLPSHLASPSYRLHMFFFSFSSFLSSTLDPHTWQFVFWKQAPMKIGAGTNPDHTLVHVLSNL